MPETLAGNVKSPLTAEQKNVAMSEARSFLSKFLEAALKGDAPAVQTMAVDYANKHNLTVFDVFTQFKDGRKRTALHFACSSNNNDTQIVRALTLSEWAQHHKLVEKDEEHNHVFLRAKDTDGITPFMLAAQGATATLERVTTLLEAGGTKLGLARSKDGATALHYAAGAGANKDVIQALFEAGKVAAKTHSKQGGTPLHWAAASKKNVTETIKALLADPVNADINAANDQGLTALIVAVATGNDDNATCLIQHGADRGILLGGNLTVYHMAADTNMAKTLAAMLEFDKALDLHDPANLSAKCCALCNDRGETPLDLALIEKHVACVKLLLPFTKQDDESKIDPNDDQALQEYIQNRSTQLLKHRADNPVAKRDNPSQVEEQTESEISKLEAEAKLYAIEAKSKFLSDSDKQQASEHKTAGNKHFQAHEYDKAVEEYTIAIQLNPGDATFYSNRSASFMALGRHMDGLYDAVVCRHLNPDWPKGCYRLAVARLALGLFEDAALAAWEGVQLDKENDELKTLLQKAVKQGRKEHHKTSEQDR